VLTERDDVSRGSFFDVTNPKKDAYASWL
jgi:hypothetical protein